MLALAKQRVRTWYVDSAHGNDTYNGRAAGHAFRTIGALLAKSLRPGDAIFLARGSVWREQLTCPCDRLSITAYGQGAMPMLDASDPIAAGSWTKTAGQTVVYQATVALAGTDVAQFVSVWENEARFVRAASIAACNATAGSYYPSSDSAASITLYVHASDGSSPATNGKTYEYSARPFSITGTGQGGNGLRINGIHGRRNLANGGSFKIYANGAIINCVASEGNKHNVYIGPGSYAMSVEADRSYFNADAFMFVFNGESMRGSEVSSFINCYAHDSTAPTCAGFGGHSNDATRFGGATFRACRVVNCTRGFSIGDSRTVQAIDCTTSNPVPESNTGDLWTNAGSVLVDNCTLSGKTDFGGRAVQIDAGPDSAYAVTLRNSRLTGGNAFISNANNTAVTLRNNVMTGQAQFGVYLNGTNSGLDALGNTFTAAWSYYYIDKAPLGAVVSDHNIFVSPSGNEFEMPSGTQWTLAGWKATGQDTHSTP